MQNTMLIHKVLKLLEVYILKKNGFSLVGHNDYELILFVPSDSHTTDCHFSLMLSAVRFDNASQRDVIQHLLHYLKSSLNVTDYHCISRINIIHSQDPFVKKIKNAFASRLETIEINKYDIGGGIGINHAFMVKSLILDRLIPEKVLTLEIRKDADDIATIQASIVRIEKDLVVYYYTDKGIREIYNPGIGDLENGHAKALMAESEGYLIKNEYMSKIGWDKIVRAV